WNHRISFSRVRSLPTRSWDAPSSTFLTAKGYLLADTAIRVRGLEKHFGEVHALDGVDIEVPRGTVFGLLGPNGAGKTTMVRILTTLLPPDGGKAEVAGYDVVRDAPALRSVIGLTGQYAAADEHLTGRE